jgi:hypothetical protein
MEVARIAPDRAIVPRVQHDDDQIIWDQACESIGRVPWKCGYILPQDDPSARAIVPIFNAAIVPWQTRYDLGLTRDCRGV